MDVEAAVEPFLIVGLGNPGGDYQRTRHNAGFLLAEVLAERWDAHWQRESQLQARLARVRRGARSGWLCQPLTFMNASGEAMAAVVRYHQIPVARSLVVVDDADLELGTLRMRPDGSSGGHHGLESIERHLGTRAYPRLRLGIGRNASAGREITGHVLGRFSAADSKLFEQVLVRAVDQVECWLDLGIEPAMARYNGRVKPEEETT